MSFLKLSEQGDKGRIPGGDSGWMVAGGRAGAGLYSQHLIVILLVTHSHPTWGSVSPNFSVDTELSILR